MVVAAGLGLAAIGLATDDGSGPLHGNTGDAFSMDVRPRHEAWDGIAAVRNTGKETAVLDGVRIVGKSRGLRLVRVYASHTQATAATDAAGRNWPPARRNLPLRRLTGTRIPPGGRVRVLLRFRTPAGKSRQGFTSLELRYHDATDSFTLPLKHQLVLCVSRRTVACHVEP